MKAGQDLGFGGFEFQTLNSSLGVKGRKDLWWISLQRGIALTFCIHYHLFYSFFFFLVGVGAEFQHSLELQKLALSGEGWVPKSLPYLSGFQTQNSDSSSRALPSLAHGTAWIPAAWLRGLGASVICVAWHSACMPPGRSRILC